MAKNRRRGTWRLPLFSHLDCAFVAAIAPGIDEGIILVYAHNFAMVSAFLADDFAGGELEIGNVEIERLALRGRGIGRQQCGTISSHQMAIGVNQNGLVQRFFEEVNHANVLAHSSLEHDRRLDAFAFAHVVQVVGGNCFA